MAGETAAAPTTGATGTEGKTATASGTTAAPEPKQPEKKQETATAEPEDILTGKATTEGKKPDGAPDGAEIAVKFPEGVEVDSALMSKFIPIAKDLKLDSAGAQRLADLFVESQNLFVAKADEAWTKTKQGWLDAVKSDPDLGGTKFEETVSLARKAIEKFGGDGLRKAMNEFGLGNHPEFVRFAARIGRAISEDSIKGVSGTPTANNEEAILREMFPSMYQ